FGAGRPRQVLDDLLATLAREPYVADVAEVAAPGRTAVALVTLKVSDPDSVLALVPVARAAARRALGALPPPDRDAYEALVTGDTPLERDMLTVTTEDVERSEWRLVPLTGAILLVALGSPVAAAVASTPLPAAVAVVGRRVGGRRGTAGRGAQAVWDGWARLVARHPGRALLGGGVVIAALTGPLAGLRIGLPARHWWPSGTEAGAGLERLALVGGAGYVQPIHVAVEWPAGRRAVDPGALRALRAFSDSLRAD